MKTEFFFHPGVVVLVCNQTWRLMTSSPIRWLRHFIFLLKRKVLR